MSFFDGTCLFFAVPIILCIAYSIVVWLWKGFEEINNNNIKRTYYLLFLVWYYLFSIFYHEDISQMKSAPLLGIPGVSWNFIILGLIMLGIWILWEWLFVIPRSIREIALGGLKITSEEKKNLQESTQTFDQAISAYKDIYENEYRMICQMREYVLESDKNPETMYIELMGKYSSLRKNVDISCFKYDTDGLSSLKRYLGIDSKKFTRIFKSIEKEKFYMLGNNQKEVLITVVETSFLQGRLIILLSGSIVPLVEYIVIGNIISTFDLVLDNIIKEDTITSLTDTIDMMANPNAS